MYHLCSSTDSGPTCRFAQEPCWQRTLPGWLPPAWPWPKGRHSPCEKTVVPGHWLIAVLELSRGGAGGKGCPGVERSWRPPLPRAESFLPLRLYCAPCKDGLCQVSEPAPGCPCLQVSAGSHCPWGGGHQSPPCFSVSQPSWVDVLLPTETGGGWHRPGLVVGLRTPRSLSPSPDVSQQVPP